jgi:UDP-glucose 4-epimerase
MNILVVGANGLVGRYLVKLLSERYKDNLIIALVRDKKKLNFELSDNVTVIENDLGNMDLSLLSKNIDVIYYLAQSKRFRDFLEGSEDVLKINVVFPVILSNWAVNVGVKKFIFASSGEVYTDNSKTVKEFFILILMKS